MLERGGRLDEVVEPLERAFGEAPRPTGGAGDDGPVRPGRPEPQLDVEPRRDDVPGPPFVRLDHADEQQRLALE